MQGVERYKVRLGPHDERWHDEFLTVRARIQALWNEAVVESFFSSLKREELYQRNYHSAE